MVFLRFWCVRLGLMLGSLPLLWYAIDYPNWYARNYQGSQAEFAFAVALLLAAVGFGLGLVFDVLGHIGARARGFRDDLREQSKRLDMMMQSRPGEQGGDSEA